MQYHNPGLIDPSQPVVTENGSFWAGNSKKPFSLRLKFDKKSHIRYFNIGGDYQSLLLIPLFVSRKNIGLLGLKSKYSNYFKKNEILLYENLSRDLEIAATHRDAQVDLRERIKELTCLYGVAHLAAQTDKSTERSCKVLQRFFPQPGYILRLPAPDRFRWTLLFNCFFSRRKASTTVRDKCKW